MPLELSDAEMTLLTELAAPINQNLRQDFLRAVAVELEARPTTAIGEGEIHPRREAGPTAILAAAALRRRTAIGASFGAMRGVRFLRPIRTRSKPPSFRSWRIERRGRRVGGNSDGRPL
jgi:hypothetical protein